MTVHDAFPVTFWAAGKARPKGSLKGRCLRNRDHTVVMREHTDNKAWRAAVARAARAQLPPGWVSYAGPVEVIISIFFERERGVNGDIMPSHATEWPMAPEFGDSDKHARLINDALQDAGVIADDRHVVGCRVDKEFAAIGFPGGAQITVRPRGWAP